MFRPIGYWLKEVDRLIEESFVRLLHEEGLTRRHWQALNTIADGPTLATSVDTELAPFEPTVAPVVDDLVARGWVARTGDVLTLTDSGRVAHATVRERVAASRKLITEGITADEYASTVGVLERMAGNLRAAGTAKLTGNKITATGGVWSLNVQGGAGRLSAHEQRLADPGRDRLG